MKKLITLAAALLLIGGAASAQNYLNIGYGQGLSRSAFGDMERDLVTSNVLFGGYSHNFTLVGALGTEVGANFNYDFNTTKLVDVDGKDEGGVKTQYMGIQVPVLFNYKFVLAEDLTMKLFLGPTFSYGLKYTSKPYVGEEIGYTIDLYGENGGYQRFAVSASAAFAIELANRYRLKIGYDYGLTDISQAEYLTEKENMVSFALSYIF